jgi:hypothetical protein
MKKIFLTYTYALCFSSYAFGMEDTTKQARHEYFFTKMALRIQEFEQGVLKQLETKKTSPEELKEIKKLLEDLKEIPQDCLQKNRDGQAYSKK